MRKFFIILTFVAAFCSCVKNELVMDDFITGEIAFDTPVTSNMMKSVAGSIQGNYPQEEAMGVFSYYSPIKDGNAWPSSTLISSYFEAAKFIYKSDLMSWGGETPYYWPSSGSLIFAGYSPYSQVGHSKIQNISFDIEKKSLLINGYQIENYIPMTEAAMYDGSTNYINKSQSDLMYFLPKTNSNGDFVGSTSGAPYPANFYHALARIVFTVQAETQNDIEYIRLRKIELTSIASKGDFSARTGKTQSGDVIWKLSEGSNYNDLTVLYNQSTNGGMKLSVQQRTVVELLTIPIGEHNIQVTYSLIVNGTPREETITYQAQWDAGKQYVYNLILGTDNIQLIPHITTDWINNE